MVFDFINLHKYLNPSQNLYKTWSDFIFYHDFMMNFIIFMIIFIIFMILSQQKVPFFASKSCLSVSECLNMKEPCIMKKVQFIIYSLLYMFVAMFSTA